VRPHCRRRAYERRTVQIRPREIGVDLMSFWRIRIPIVHFGTFDLCWELRFKLLRNSSEDSLEATAHFADVARRKDSSAASSNQFVPPVVRMSLFRAGSRRTPAQQSSGGAYRKQQTK
jgi:hypothetical protein